MSETRGRLDRLSGLQNIIDIPTFLIFINHDMLNSCLNLHDFMDSCAFLRFPVQISFLIKVGIRYK